MKQYPVMAMLVVLITVAPAMAVQRSGHDLLVDCSNLVKTESLETMPRENVLGMGYCIGLIDGLVTFNYVYEVVLDRERMSRAVQMCLPERFSTRQAASIIVKYLEDNPVRLDQSGQALAAQALVTAYPCAQETEKTD